METVRLMRSLEGKSRQQEGLPSGAVRKWKQGWDPKGPRSWKVTLERWETGWGGGAQAKHAGSKLGCGAASPELAKSKAVTDGCQVWGESRCGENRLGEMLGRWGSARWLPALSGGR